MVDNKIRSLLKNGYFIYDIKDKKNLNLLKNAIFRESKLILRKKFKKNFFNEFHNIDISNQKLNEYRLKLMKKVNFGGKFSKKGFEIFQDIIQKIFGLDIVAQKNVNLVIQKPNDPSQISVHRDAPPNSDYELVVWVPLVNTFKSKNMYILDKKKTAQLIKKIKRFSNDNKKSEKIMDFYYSFAFNKSKKHKLKFGQAIIFWTGLIHCVPENKEEETRWSLNFRFKNTFSPYGTKGFPDYFTVANSSPITELALEKKGSEFK